MRKSVIFLTIAFIIFGINSAWSLPYTVDDLYNQLNEFRQNTASSTSKTRATFLYKEEKESIKDVRLANKADLKTANILDELNTHLKLLTLISESKQAEAIEVVVGRLVMLELKFKVAKNEANMAKLSIRNTSKNPKVMKAIYDNYRFIELSYNKTIQIRNDLYNILKDKMPSK